MSRGFESEGSAPLGLKIGGRLSPPASRYMASQDLGPPSFSCVKLPYPTVRRKDGESFLSESAAFQAISLCDPKAWLIQVLLLGPA